VAIRLVLADDHLIVLHGLQQFFERQPGFDVVASCADVDAAIDAVRVHRPDVLVLDMRLGQRSGLDVLRTLAAEGLPCRTVLLTAAVRDQEVAEAVRLGAMGLVLKESPPDRLVECLTSVHRGDPWLDRETVTRAFRRALERESAQRQAELTLTSRELEIVRMVSQGLRNRAIAERLAISEGTVKVHLHNIYEKLGVDGRLELAVRAQDQGLV
jgi:DNA-binding NarL/FixJ family response regulator